MPQSTYTVVSNPVSTAHGSLNVLFAGESQTRPGHRIGPRVYDYYLLHHVLSGKGRYHCQDTRADYEMRAGHTFLAAPERLVSYVADAENPWRYRWVAFTGPDAAQLAVFAGFDELRPIADTAADRQPARLLSQIMSGFRVGGPRAALTAIGCLHLLLARISGELEGTGRTDRRLAGSEERLVRQIVHYLSTQYAEPVSIQDMADTFGYNRAYLSRLFKQHTDMSPVTFLLKLRIDKARLMLRERRELTIEQIASSVGFSDPLYFSKQFRRFHAQSPSAYRASLL
ncbi:AraC family transcriptional regulator [Paenibacillus sabuli]|uniref:AraC family transcriptional regulator n=1 Tax=Paenibacillus sabuli TaxID=2772509 RepID=UPI00295A78A5|nr:AraC family transcriptional regulator [Paenibacillus sabuli]